MSKKNWRITAPFGMSSPFDSEQCSEFQVNIFSNNRDIRLHLENSKSKKGHNFVKKLEDYLPYWYGFPF